MRYRQREGDTENVPDVVRQFFDRLPRYARFASLLLLAAASLMAFDLFWARPTRTELALQRQRLDQRRVEVVAARRASTRLKDLEEQVRSLRARLGRFQTQLPGDRDAPTLLRRLQSMATRSRLSVRGFTPQGIESGDSYVAWPIRLELVGSYHDLGRFFDAVAQLPQLLVVDELLIEAIDPPQSRATVRAECRVATYVRSSYPDVARLDEPPV